MSKIVHFDIGDTLIMKKNHPCATHESNKFLVLRTGTDILIRCIGCGRELHIHRLKLEPSIKCVLPKVE